jgi:ribose transport system substrate-binding protein
MIPMTGEGNNGFLRIWQEMDLDTVAPQYPTWFGQQAVIAAVRLLEGEAVYHDYALRPAPITKETIAEYYRPDLNDSYWVGSSLPDETLVEIYGK